VPFSEAVRIALASLRAHKLRSALTMLGIIIGVSSVVAVVAITSGLDRYIAERVLSMGGRSFTIHKFEELVMSPDEWIRMWKRRNLRLADVEFVRRSCTVCSEVGASLRTGDDVRWGRVVQESVAVQGITENVSRIGSVRELEAGRHLTAEDVERARPVAVIGTDLVEAFFGAMEPLGRTISVNGHPLKVVGVAERKGKIFGNSQDNFVWIPITLFQKLYGSRQSISIEVEAAGIEHFQEAQDQVRVALRQRRHVRYMQPDDFSIRTGEMVLDLWQKMTGGIYAATLLVTAISLFVGGIVVMNIMLVSVTERTAEIGVRKALGARRRDILRQFLVESIVLCALGGALGVIGASVFAFGLGRVIGGMMHAEFAADVRWWAVLLSLAVSTLVGLVAGVYPASRAAALDPVAALRQE